MSIGNDKKTLNHFIEVSFKQYGGSECFFADIDGDGKFEIITYQGPGCYSVNNVLEGRDYIKPLLPESVSISAFRFDGTRIWTWGKPNSQERPYLSHAYESCVATGDIDGDGTIEIVIADGNRIIVLDGKTGKEKKSRSLPEDNYSIVQVVGEPTEKNEAAIVIKNGEYGYGKWRYGEPVLGLNTNLEIVWGPEAIPGGGHHILVMDLNGDGKKEYLIGYCAVDLKGEILWTADTIDVSLLNQKDDHVDYTDIIRRSDGAELFAIAGSDKLYLVQEGGKTTFSVPGPHVQGSALGHFRSDSEFQVAIYNAPNGPMVLYDPSGRQIWYQATPRKWPLEMRQTCQRYAVSPFHRNRPIVTIPGKEQDWIGYADGGWPWGMDGNGEITLEFQPTENSPQPEYRHTVSAKVRNDDIGYGFALQSIDIDGDGEKEAVIYDRRFLWVYKID